MKKIFTLIACLAITMSTYADWTLNVGGQDYPMTLVEGSNPETYTASVELAPGSYNATITDGSKNKSNAITTSFTLTSTQTVQFWGQYPSGKSWIAGLCNAQEYGLMDTKWRYKTFAEQAFGETQSVFYSFEAADNFTLQAGNGSKTPTNEYVITANASGNPPFTISCTEKEKKAGVKKVTLDYAKWKVTIEPATTIGIKVGAAGASTLVAPVDLTIPQDVKAYTLAYDNEKKALVANMIETTIPANTPVLLNAEEGTYSFAIGENFNVKTGTYSDEPYNIDVTSENNVLVGVMQPHLLYSGNYVLQNGDDGIGFYKVVLNADKKETFKINNHRCYIPASAIPAQGARSLSIVFPETTGIEEVKTASAKSVKKMVDGRLVIEKNGNTFNAAGQIIK